MDTTSADAARRELIDFSRCAACGATLRVARCDRCGLDLAGAEGSRIAEASRAAVRALDERQRVIDAVRAAQQARSAGAAGGVPGASTWVPGAPYGDAAPVRPAAAAQPSHAAQPSPVQPATLAPAGRPAPPPGPAAPVPPVPPYLRGPAPAPRAERPFDVARLFALAGAGLVAAAALVFAFFVLAEAPAARVVVLLLATAGAAAGTLVLRRTGIGGSAEAVGGLVAALAVVDAWVVAELADAPARWVVLAVLLAGVGTGLPAAGLAARVRSWTVAVLALPLVPLCVAGAVGGPWAWHLGLLAAGLVTLVRAPLGRAVAGRFERSSPALDGLLVLAAAVLLVAALAATVALPAPVRGWDSGGIAVGLLLAAAVAAVQTRSGQAAAWTSASGALTVLGAVVAAIGAVPSGGGAGPVAGAGAWTLLVALPLAGGTPTATDVLYRARVTGGWVALVLATVPGTVAGTGSTLALLGALGAPVPDRLGAAAFAEAGGSGVGPVLALAVLAGALAAIGRIPLAPVRHRPWPGAVPAGIAGVPGAGLPGSGLPGGVGGPALVPVVRPPAVVAFGRACLPAAVVLAVAAVTGLLHPWSPALLVGELVLAVLLVEAARRLPSRDAGTEPPTAGAVPAAATPWRTTLVAAAFAQLAFLTALSWVSRPTAALGAVAAVVLLLRTRRLVTADLRGVLVAAGAAYAGAVLAVLLGWLGWDGFGVAGGVSVALTVAAAVLTVVPRVGRDTWLAVLAVAVVPAGVAVVAVAADRTWWSAGAAAALLVLEGVLLDTRVRPVPAWLRVLAAALVLPTLAVALICAGAVLLPGSASPVLLPVVAVLAAAAAVAAPPVAGRLRRRALDVPAEHARVALEAAAAATGAVALLLAIARDSTGAGTVLVVCAILAAGGTAVARRPDRRPVWWASAALWTGVVWSALAWWEVGLVEAYTVPPALAAVVVGTLLSRRADGWRPLVQSGTALLVAPTLLLAVLGRETGLRSAVLLACAALAVGVAVLADADADPDADRAAGPAPRARALRVLTDALLGGAAVAALAGAVRSAHLATSTPEGSPAGDARLFGLALLWSLAGAVLLGAACRLLASRSADDRAALLRRWALGPALVAGTVGVLVAVRPSWAAVWTGWVVELGLLALAVLAVRADVARPRPAGPASPDSPASPSALVLPPGWFLWLGGLAWAIGAWSTRLLRVEVFALPLGLALTAMGLVALRASLADRATPATPATPARRSAAGWPVGYEGSVATLTPGVLATLGPSMLAIWTDPMTWRAILVVVLALGFMLLGARQLLRAPLVVGAAALPVAVVSVFAAQIGRTISAGPWLLTLLAAGGLLLVLGIFAERRRAGAQDDQGAPRVLR